MVALLAATVAALVLVGDPRARDLSPEVRYRSLAEVTRLGRDGPVIAVEDPEVALITVPVERWSSASDWGISDGYVAVSDREVLVALDLRDPDDGAIVVWCPTSRRFEHPHTGASYAADGTWRSGPASRGLDRFGVRTTGAGVVVETRRWVSGPPRDSTAGDERPAGPPC